MPNSSPVRRAALAVTAAAVLTGAIALPQAAPAAPVPLTDAAAATTLAAELGEHRTGGAYFDETGQLVVAVTDRDTAAQVEAAGGVAELVTYSSTHLESIHATLDDEIAFTDPIPGTSWGVDASENRVIVEIDDSVQGEDLARLEAAVAPYGDAVRVDRIPGVFTMDASMPGGVGIRENNANPARVCTAGFNVWNSAHKKYMITAGHCVRGGKYYWERSYNGQYLGKVTTFDDGGKDYAVLEYLNSNVTPYGVLIVQGAEQQIDRSRYAYDGEKVKRVGTTSSDLVGEVLVPSTTFTWSDGSVFTDMIKTSLCSLGGDSGGPLFAGSTALGVLSGGPAGPSTCNSSVSSDRSYYTPIQYVLNKHGLEVF